MSAKSFTIFFFIIIVISIYRLFNLKIQPPFIDEAIYGQFVSTISRSPSINNLWAPAETGFAPIFIWLSSLTNFVVKNSIFAGRITSVLLYNLSVIILYFYLKKIRAKNIIIPLVFFCFNPFIFIYSQMGLMEITLIFVTLLLFLQTENTIKKPSLANAILLSILMPLLLITKYLGIFMLPYVFLRFTSEKQVVYLIKIVLLSLLFTFCLFSLIFPVTSQMLSLKTIFSGPANFANKPIVQNSKEIFGIFFDYFHPLVILLTIAALLFVRNKIAKTICLLFLIQIFYFIFFTIGFYPRYLIYSALFVTITLSSIKDSKVVTSLIVFSVILLYFSSDWCLAKGAPGNAKLAKRDIWQFTENKSISGEKTLSDLNSIQKGKKICVRADYKFYYETVAEAYFPGKQINLKTCKIN